MMIQYIYHTYLVVFFYNDTATTEIYTLSLHDALPISYDLVTMLENKMKSVAACEKYQKDFGDEQSLKGLLDEIKQDDEKQDRKSTRLNSSHVEISYAVFCLKKKKKNKK